MYAASGEVLYDSASLSSYHSDYNVHRSSMCHDLTGIVSRLQYRRPGSVIFKKCQRIQSNILGVIEGSIGLVHMSFEIRVRCCGVWRNMHSNRCLVHHLVISGCRILLCPHFIDGILHNKTTHRGRRRALWNRAIGR
jgi:hypothetical protein